MVQASAVPWPEIDIQREERERERTRERENERTREREKGRRERKERGCPLRSILSVGPAVFTLSGAI